MDYREFQAKTLDEAITIASIELGVPSSELFYEVTEKGSAGILGFGKKDVCIRACRLSEKEESEAKLAKEEIKSEEPKDASPVKEERFEKNQEAEKHYEEKHHFEKSERPERVIKKVEPKEVEEITKAASEFLKEVFSAMGIEVSVNCDFSERDNSLTIDLEGPHMGIIIGKRGQTLDSLQYLVNLVVNKKSETYIRIKLDTEDYRRRRKETLENLAKNIAHKVKKTGKPVVLEAMNPYERRTIHYALQKDRYVTTYSEGEEPFRHVVVAANSQNRR